MMPACLFCVSRPCPRRRPASASLIFWLESVFLCSRNTKVEPQDGGRARLHHEAHTYTHTQRERERERERTREKNEREREREASEKEAIDGGRTPRETVVVSRNIKRDGDHFPKHVREQAAKQDFKREAMQYALWIPFGLVCLHFEYEKMANLFFTWFILGELMLIFIRGKKIFRALKWYNVLLFVVAVAVYFIKECMIPENSLHVFRRVRDIRDAGVCDCHSVHTETLVARIRLVPDD